MLGRVAVPPAAFHRHLLPARIAAAVAHAGASQRYCLVVVPTYNEALNIAHLVAAILAQGPQFDVLVVDDSSPDGTGAIADALAARSPRVQAIHRPGKLGLGGAYLAGFRAGLRQGYEFLCEMDADFSHQPRYLPRLLAAAEGEADVVLGSRNVPGGRVENWSWLRAALSYGGNLNARAILGLPIRDCTGGFKCFRADALRQIQLDSVRSNGYAFQIELNYRCYQAGLRIREVPIVFPNRVAGRSKMSWHIVWEAALMIWRLRLSPNPI
jgi:dolichol-phosphate mannosyltransferase